MRLEDLSDAEAELLRTYLMTQTLLVDEDFEVKNSIVAYILGLFNAYDPEEVANKPNYVYNLNDFLNERTESFVDQLFDAVATKAYLSTPAATLPEPRDTASSTADLEGSRTFVPPDEENDPSPAPAGDGVSASASDQTPIPTGDGVSGASTNAAGATSTGYGRNPGFFPEYAAAMGDWSRRPTYIVPSYNKTSFQVGDVIRRTWHVPNMNRRLRPGHFCVTETGEERHHTVGSKLLKAFVFSKTRMFVVIYKHQHTMFCLPLYSYGKRGFAGIRDEKRWAEHIAVRGTMHREGFKNPGPHAPVDFVHLSTDIADALDVTTLIDMASGETISWMEEAIWPVGRLTKNGYERLVEHWKDLNKAAEIDVEKTANWPVDDWQSPESQAERDRKTGGAAGTNRVRRQGGGGLPVGSRQSRRLRGG